MKERSNIIKTKVLDRTPGGFISKLEITEKMIKGGEEFTHIYFLTHSELQNKVNNFIEEQMEKSKNEK